MHIAYTVLSRFALILLPHIHPYLYYPHMHLHYYYLTCFFTRIFYYSLCASIFTLPCSPVFFLSLDFPYFYYPIFNRIFIIPYLLVFLSHLFNRGHPDIPIPYVLLLYIPLPVIPILDIPTKKVKYRTCLQYLCSVFLFLIFILPLIWLG